MRKKSIVKDFKNKEYPGSLIMDETNNFMNSVLMDMDDEIRISYSYTVKDVSLGEDILKAYNAISYDVLKKKSIEISIDEKQSKFDNDKNTAWIIKFQHKNILREYLYNQIYTTNTRSPFREIPTSVINIEELGGLCLEYIDKNVLNKYEVKEFILWTKFYDLNLNSVPLTGVGTGILQEINPKINLLYKTPEFTFMSIPDITDLAVKDVDKEKEYITMKEQNDDTYLIGYKQRESSQFKTFTYYYDVIFKRK